MSSPTQRGSLSFGTCRTIASLGSPESLPGHGMTRHGRQFASGSALRPAIPASPVRLPVATGWLDSGAEELPNLSWMAHHGYQAKTRSIETVITSRGETFLNGSLDSLESLGDAGLGREPRPLVIGTLSSRPHSPLRRAHRGRSESAPGASGASGAMGVPGAGERGQAYGRPQSALAERRPESAGNHVLKTAEEFVDWLTHSTPSPDTGLTALPTNEGNAAAAAGGTHGADAVLRE